MKIEGVPFTRIDWTKAQVGEHPGEVGVAVWRTMEFGNVRVRRVEYSAGYKSDHWCAKGHVVLVVEGVLETSLKDGRVVVTRAGEGWMVADDEQPHRSAAPGGAVLIIVD